MRKLLGSFVLIAAFLFLPAPSPAAAAASAQCSTPAGNLRLGMSGADVKSLQIFLNSHGFPVSSFGSGASGNEGAYFGLKTQIALQKFQAANGIAPASGYFGPATRARVAALCSGATALNTLAPVALNVGGGNGLSLPVLSAPPAGGTTIVPPAAASAAGSINPQSIVGLLCFLSYRGQLYPMKGSGVIVNPEGYVLTARHAVDPHWTATAYASNLSAEQQSFYAEAVLDHCEIGLPPAITLPAASEIQSANPATLITRHFQYQAGVLFLPPDSGLSPEEYKNADFAVLKITAATADCTAWNSNCSDWGSFPYTPVLGDDLPGAGTDQVLSYGYPAETVNRSGQAFYDFYLKGAAGTVGLYFKGAAQFQDIPENFSFKAQDIQGGRSGSPLFYKGRVMGILYGSTSSAESYNVTIAAIRKLLAAKGLAYVLRSN